LQTLAKTFRRLEDPGAWRSVVPWLTVDDRLDWTSSSGGFVDESSVAAGRTDLRDTGFMRLESLLRHDEAASLARAAAAIRAEGLPPTFLYVYDEPWLLLGRILPYFARLLGADVEPLADVWAWHVDPRVDAGGWAPHRGWYDDVRSSDGLPSLVNVWISLTRATPRNACIHAVSFGEDPAWPGDLGRQPFDMSPARSLPTEPGTLLAWNANVLHSGGTCDPTYDQPRASASFTLRRRGWRGCAHPAVPFALPFQARLDILADLMCTYGSHELAPESPAMQWALASATMRNLARARRPGHSVNER
jgi:hypothetical protein